MKTNSLLIFLPMALLAAAECFGQTIVWNGNGDGASWTDAQNWAGQQVPGPGNNAVITNGAGSVVVISSAVSVENILCDKDLTITNGSLTVTAGASSVEGTLTVGTAGALLAAGGGTTFTSTGPVNADDGNFTVSAGAVMTLPGLQNYNKNCDGANWTATGAGSELNLAGLTNITGAACSYPTIQAEAGGQILLTNLGSIQAGPLAFQADGTNSLIDLSALSVCAGQGNYFVTFESSSGGFMEIPRMTGGPLVGVILNPGGSMPVAQIQMLSSVSADGVTANFAALTNINDGNFTLSGGASVTAPVLRNYTKNCNGANWTVTGADSVLNLPALTNITGAACSYPTIQAEAGGQILCANLASIEAGPLAFAADGTNSLINLNALSACSGQNGYTVTFEASSGGTLQATNMTGGPLVGVTVNPNANLELGPLGQLSVLTINGAPATFPALTNMAGGSLVVTGATNAFPALTDIDDGNFTLSGGASVTLGALRNYTKNCDGANWTVTGADSVLDLPALTNMTGAACSYPTIQAEAGGQILCANLASIEAGPLAFAADGTNSLINLSKLTACNGQNNYLVTFETSAGGTLEIPNMTGGPLVGVTINSNSTMQVGAIGQLNSITINGANVTFSSLTNVSGGSITVNGGTANFPALTSFDGSGGSSFEAINGATVTAGSLSALEGVAVYVSPTSTFSLNSVTNLSGSSLTVTNGSMTLANVVNIANANLSVSGGATLSLPGVVNCNFSNNCVVAVWQVSGAGSVLSLGGLTNLSAPSYCCCDVLQIQALAGGAVNMAGLISMSGVVEVTSTGSGSEINLPDLQSFAGVNNNYAAQLQTGQGGTILAGQLTSLTGVSTVLGAGTLNLGAVTNLSFSTLSITNGTVTLTNVADVVNANLYVSGGASLSLPEVVNCNFSNNCVVAVWQSSGAGSVLSLGGLTNLSSPAYCCCDVLQIQALAGGAIDFGGMISMSGVVEVTSAGSGSEINLPDLQSFAGVNNNYAAQLQTGQGGTILAGQLTSLTGVSTVLGAGTLNLGAVTNLSFSTLSITNGTVTLTNVADVANANLYVSGGASLSLPEVVNCNFSNNCVVAVWQSSGAGSVLSLGGLTNLSSPSYCCCDVLQIQALAGGAIDFGGLISMSGVVEVTSAGSGSEINLSELQSFAGVNNNYAAQLQTGEGGTILAGQLTGLTGVSTVLGGGTLNLGAVTNLSYTTLSVTNGSVTLNNVDDVANANLYVSGGATLSLPGVANCNFGNNCVVAVWQSSGAGSVLSLGGLTNLSVPSYCCCDVLQIQSLAGGAIELGGLISMSGVVEVTSAGSGSEINFSDLQSFAGVNNNYAAQLQTGQGGTILAGQLTSLAGVSTVLGAGTLNLSSATNLTSSTLSITNGTVTLSNVLDVANANLYVSGGASLSLPGVVNCNFGSSCLVAVWQASGAGSVLSLGGLTNLSVPSYCCCDVLQIQSLAGGAIELGGLISMSGVVEVTSAGSGSEINFSDLQSFAGVNNNYAAQLQTGQGGTILAGQLTSFTGASTVLGAGALNLGAVTNLSYSTLSVTNGAVTLNNVADVANANLYVSGGASLSLPGVVNCVENGQNSPIVWQASGAGSVLSLTGLTNIVVPSDYGEVLQIQALSGGEVNLSQLISQSGPAQVESSGSGSVVNVTRLINYSMATTTFTATGGGVIVQAQPLLVITANNASMTYGGTVPALSVSYSGFTNGDTAASLTVAPSVSTTGTSLSHAGTYPITASGAVDTNYTIVYAQGTLTINPAPLTITASNASKTYGQTAVLPATAFSSAGLLNGDTIAGVTLSSAGSVSNASKGNYSIVATNATGPRAANYAITYVNGTLTVNPALLTITADNAAKFFGKTLTFSGTAFTAAGLQNGDTVGSVTLASPGASASATVAGSPYPIMPSAATGGSFAPANYAISYVNGSLTVVPVGTPPSISSVAPAAGPVTGGTAVTINGANFEPGATVTFGSSPAISTAFVSSNVLSAVTPASSSGAANVTVNNPDGNSITDNNSFEFGNAPDITTQPTNLTLDPGQTARFQVVATGDPTLAYQWQFNGVNLSNNTQVSGSATATLTVANVAVADDGYYVCVVTNLYESVASAAAVLSVVAPPSALVVSPSSVSVGQGGSASFSVANAGTAPFSYFWYQNGGLVPGQTNSVLNIAGATANASYIVVVSNASGSATSAPVSLTLLGYCINGQPTQPTYPEGTNFIPINVTTYNCATSAPEPNSPAVVWLSIDGTSRDLTVTTDGSGNATAYFTPLPVEVGLVRYGFALPGQPEPAFVGSFTIIGMNLSAQSESPNLVVGAPQTNTLLLNNLTAVPLTGLTATVQGAPANVNVQVSVPSSVSSNGAVQTTYILEATSVGEGQASFSIQYTSAQGATVTLPFSATISPPTAQLAATPPSLVAAMIDGAQTLVTFTVTNFGAAPSGPLQVNLPAAPWLSAATAQPIPSLAPGQSGQIMLSLMPTNGQALGEYPGDLVIQGSNTSLTVPFVFTAVSSLKGNLQVTAQDELSIYGAGNPNLSNATVTVSDFLTGTNVGVQVTGSNGIVTFSNLTSAYYTVTAQAPGHGAFGTTLLLAANTTTPVTAFLPLNLVDYTWTVIPTDVPDDYYFTLTTIFVTEVPWPEVSVSPINLCDLTNCDNQVDLVITNAGLIAAEGLQLVINNSDPNWSLVTLVTNLGNLAAQSSIVVPATFARVGCNTNPCLPSATQASLNWYVAALNGTEYNNTPIFFYNACCPSSTAPASHPAGGVAGGGITGAAVTQPINYTTVQPGAVVNVTLQIDQTAVLTANAFHATLNLTNGSDSPITDLQVTLSPLDTNGAPATNAFFVQTPLLYGINAVDGTGSLGVGAGGQAAWTIVPTTNAAPMGTSNYGFGGSISYMFEGQQVTIPLYPVQISVLPEPRLYLDYFLQHDVYSQDPFTAVYEPPIPFGLGLRVRNLGYGVANNFNITSAQPVIINNANGLLINFQIISSEVGTNMTPVPSLTLNMGDIDPGSNVVGTWYLTSSLEGDFTNFQATFQHSDSLGGQETSLVQGVKIHEMNHVVEITCPGDDRVPDFLCNDTTNVDALPDDVYSSDGNVYPVTSLTGAVSSGSVSGVGSSITINDAADNIPSGFVYFQLVDPSGGQYAITSVKRSDGTELLVGPDVWQTPERLHMVPPQPNNLIHIFDCDSDGSYTVTYGPPVGAPIATTLAAQNVTPTNATLAGEINPESGATEYYFQWGSTTNYGNVSQTNTLSANLGSAQAVTAYINNLDPSSTTHYRLVAVNGAGTSLGADLTVATPALPIPLITPVANQSVIVGQTLLITNSAIVATPPVTWSLGGIVPAGAAINPTNGVFSWTPVCDQGSTTNQITVVATDSGAPPLSNYTTFAVVVSECVELGLGSAVLQAGQSSSIAVSLFSTVGITNLSFVLGAPANRFTNYTINASNSAIATATVQAPGTSPPLFTLVTKPGQTLPSPSVLGTIGFTALPGDSAFVTVAATNIIGFQSGGGAVGNVTSVPGQITVVGLHPLLGSAASGSKTITLTLFGNPGSNYQLAFTTNLDLTNWQTGPAITLTNVQQTTTLPATNAHMYFRLQ